MRHDECNGGPGPNSNGSHLVGYWDARVDVSRTPSPRLPSKRMKMTLQDATQGYQMTNGASRGVRHGVSGVAQMPVENGYVEDATASIKPLSAYQSSVAVVGDNSEAFESESQEVALQEHRKVRRRKMRTGCVPCLIQGIPCDPRNPACRTAMSEDWQLNEEGENHGQNGTSDALSLTLVRPDVSWRRSWRERHSLNFFVNYSAPQMAGFFDSSFWQRMVIQTSYHEPAILHAITAIGALHECIMQRAFADERRKAQAIEFALSQCNKAIGCLTSRQNGDQGLKVMDSRQLVPSSSVALTTCVLFTCFEAMQGRCDSAVNHALQGRRLLYATDRSDISNSSIMTAEENDLEQMRPIVERLEVQATALVDKGRRPDVENPEDPPPLPTVDYIFSLDHAHNTLHTALNSVMRFMQGFHPTAPRDQLTLTMAEKYLRYAPWFATWEEAFTTFLSSAQRQAMSDADLKRAMVLKANHLVGTMLASVDQAAGPTAYDAYESEFRAIIDLCREVLASYSCPPLPTLSGGNQGTPYLSFSLWVTDPLWMAISRCRVPSVRQAAFTLLSSNPRQEGIWHAGPQVAQQKYLRKAEGLSARRKGNGVKAESSSQDGEESRASGSGRASDAGSRGSHG